MKNPFNPILLCMLAAISFQASAALIMLDRIAAIVDDDVVLQSEVNARKQSIKAQMASNPNSRIPPDDVLTSQILDRLIVESIQIQMADRAGVKISDAELNKAMRGIAEQNNLTLDEFKVAIENDGISYVDMRNQIRKELKIGRVQQGIMRGRIQISEQEIRSFLESDLGANITADEYRLAHILLPTPSEPTAEQIQEVRRKAESLLAQIEAGADFQSLAVEYSAGQNALEGGDLGWRKPVQLPTMFSDIAQEMEVGEVRGPIKSGSGFHLIKMLAKRGAQANGKIAQTRVRHVLIQPSEIRSETEARELAESLREEVINGRSFEDVAKLYSDDPGSALSGGDLGWARAGEFVPEFEKVMDSARINEVSKVFRSQHGYHFLEVTDRRVEDFTERFRMGQAENYLRNQKFDEELENWLREIRDEAFVEIRN